MLRIPGRCAYLIPFGLIVAACSDGQVVRDDFAAAGGAGGTSAGTAAGAGQGAGGTTTASMAGAGTLTPGACSASFDSIRDSVFKTSCDGVGCHGSQNPAAGLDLVNIGQEQLTGTSSALCSGWSLIVPGSPDTSFLYQKVAGTPACGENMPLGTHLSAASSQCLADWIRGMAAGGTCEKCGGAECVALASDPQNCGVCGNVCPSGVACDNGSCGCPGGGQVCGGVCVDTATDAKNCGACGKACNAGSTCSAGQCACPTNLTTCGAGCVDLTSDAQNCGSCGTKCGTNQVCLAGKCSSGCGALTQCGTSCVDTQSSVLNCGACGKTCAAGLTCNAGQCGCTNGGQLCGGACVALQTDAKNCGSCGKACGAGEACVAGACQCAASGSVSFKTDVAPVLQSACTAAGCHSGLKPKENLSLESTKSYSELVNVSTSQCNGSRKLVVPGSPASSYLVQKLLNVDICTGTQMPKAGQTLPQAQLDKISAWICSGAPNN